MDIIAEHVRKARGFANVVVLRRRDGKEGPELVFGMRTGLFGHPTTTVLRVGDEKVAGACEDVKELSEIVTQLGLLTMAALFNYNLAFGPEGLAPAMAKWAGIDLEALKKAAAEGDAAEHAAEAATLAAEGKVIEVDEDGDTVVRPAEPGELPGVSTPAEWPQDSDLVEATVDETDGVQNV